jgi:hypothetical protein
MLENGEINVLVGTSIATEHDKYENIAGSF